MDMHEKREWYEKGPHWVSRPDVVTPAEEHWEYDVEQDRRAMAGEQRQALEDSEEVVM